MALAQILFRRGTSVEWAAANPVLAQGEPGLDTTVNRWKLGDGVTPFLTLPWAALSDADVARLEAAADALVGAVTPTDAVMATVASDPDSAFATQQRTAIAGSVAAATDGLGGPGDAVAVVGHSMVKSTGTDWPTTILEPALGVDVINFGFSGQASTDIAIHFGAIDPLLAVTGNQIPASGPVTVTAVAPATKYRSNGSNPVSWVGELAGVPGTLLHSQSPSEGWTFTRTDAGAAVACPAGTPFVCTEADDFRDRTLIVWAARNNTEGGVDMDPAFRDIDLIIRHQKAVVKRVLVLGELNATNEPPGNAKYEALLRFNRLAALRYPGVDVAFLDIRVFLLSNGLQLAGISPTAQDRVDLANGAVPTSLHAVGDALHPNAAGYAVVSKAVAQFFATRGWVAGLIPSEKPGQVVGLAAGTATSSTQPLTWTASAGALGYMIERRAVGAPSWTFDSVATTASKTVTALSAGTGYDYRATAYNAAGAGAPSAVITASTTGAAPSVVGSDNFNSADVANVSGRELNNGLGGSGTRAWATSGTGIGIVSNQLRRTAGTVGRSMSADFGVASGRAVTAIPALGSTSVTIQGRRTDDNNTYQALFSGSAGTVVLRKVSGGTPTTFVTESGFTVGSLAEFKVSTDGGAARLEAFVNGVLAASWTDSSAPILTGNTWGLILQNDSTLAVDDFVLYDA